MISDIQTDDLRTGNIASFELLFKQLYPRLINYADRTVMDTQQAQDIVQEVFCQLWDNRKSLNVKTSLQAYLFKMVYTRCIDALRRSKREQNFADKTLQDYYFTSILQTPEAEIELINSDLREIILQAVETLPPKCREVFISVKLTGKTHQQTAQQMGISVKTVENQMTIALARLRRDLEWLLQLFVIFFISS